MAEAKQFKFGISFVSILGYSYTSPFEIRKDFNPEKDPLVVKLDVNYRWNIEKEVFAVVLHFSYAMRDKEDNYSEILRLSFLTEFRVEDLKNILIVRSSSDFDLDQRLESTLVGISISTGRGILYEKTAGTAIMANIFPIVNPMDVILSKKFKEQNQTKKTIDIQTET